MNERNDLPKFLNEHGLLRAGAEIGVGDGSFALHIRTHWKGKTLHLIDRWRHTEGYEDVHNLSDDEFADEFLHVARTFSFIQSVAIYRMESVEAAFLFADESLDWVYIDADHSYNSVKRDLEAWYPKVRHGGLFAGHDYFDGTIAEGVFAVKRAVDEFAYQRVPHVLTTNEVWPKTWYWIKP